MKAIMVMFDSLNRHMLPPYGCTWTHAPNFSRLAKRVVTFETSYVCSMPCMPARRDLHTARPSFLHRSWGPIEPFDDSVPEMLKKAGVYTHLASDHYHYWEDGGATYHNRYNTWEFFRGQEGDPWKGQVEDPLWPEAIGRNSDRDNYIRQDLINRQFMPTESEHSQTKTFDAGIEFIRRNSNQDNWFLQLETFDPHEPFFSHERFKKLYPHDYKGPLFDWPKYDKLCESPEQVEHVQKEYAALLSMCDHSLGRVLDLMDELDLWKDTMLIVWTDHGFLLGEHDCWAKMWMPMYEEIARTPFFVWDPRIGKAGERRKSLVQPSIDLGPTLLEFFGQKRTKDMLGQSLRGVLESDKPIRETGIFGLFGAHVNITDGRYVYMRGHATADNQPLFNYTLMPTRMRSMFEPKELQELELAPPFEFTKGCRTLKIRSGGPYPGGGRYQDTLLFDLQADSKQSAPIHNPTIEQRLIGHLKDWMKRCDAPPEQYSRLGL
jgi:arylsulfatase A-like enzyme